MARKSAVETQETIDTIIDVALRHFGQHGYAGTSLEAVVAEAGVTRGALYHHFAGKQGLFEAVVRKVQQSIGEQIEAASDTNSTAWTGFVAGCHAWLAAASDSTTQRILVIDAPAVLGWDRWLELDSESGASLLREGLVELHSEEIIDAPSVDALFHLLNGAMNQAARWIAQAAESELALREAQSTLEELLVGIKRDG